MHTTCIIVNTSLHHMVKPRSSKKTLKSSVSEEPPAPPTPSFQFDVSPSIPSIPDDVYSNTLIPDDVSPIPDDATSSSPSSTMVQSTMVLYETQQQKEKFLDVLKTAIESMNKTHHIEFLKRIHGYEDGTVKINENRNGVYINLSYLPDPLIRELYDLVHYTKQQETLLNIDEASKDQLKRDFFVQDLPKQTLF